MAGCRWVSCVALVGALGASGCAAGSAGPRGPLTGVAGTRIGLDYATATPDEVYWGDLGVLPRRAELRIAPRGWMDLGGDLGWLDAGADLRVGMPSAPDRILAFNVTLGARTGALGLMKDTKRTSSYFARLEAYPLLHTSYTADGEVKTMGRAVSAVGIDGGDFYHGPSRAPSSDTGFEQGIGPRERHHIDRELRLEVAAGYHMITRNRAWFQATLQPYTVLVHEANNRHNWGMILLLSGGLFVPFQRGPSQ